MYAPNDRAEQQKRRDTTKKNEKEIYNRRGNKTFHIAFTGQREVKSLSMCASASKAIQTNLQFFFCVVCSFISHLYKFVECVCVSFYFCFSTKFRIPNCDRERERKSEQIMRSRERRRKKKTQRQTPNKNKQFKKAIPFVRCAHISIYAMHISFRHP